MIVARTESAPGAGFMALGNPHVAKDYWTLLLGSFRRTELF